MSSPELYQSIHSSNIERLQAGQIEIDHILATGEADSRLGVSLIIPVHQNSDSYHHLVQLFAEIAPDQYYYPFDDLHVTIFDFIQGSAGYQRAEALENTFLEISREVAQSFESFEIEMKGVVFSRAAGIIKGYDEDRLVAMREQIRTLMRTHQLKNDERYESRSAHVTFMRFRKSLEDPSLLAKSIQKYSEIELAKEKVAHLELVEHDWYNAQARKRVIARLPLKT